MTATVDVLIPTYCRPGALAVTLTGLVAQSFRDFRVVISDQTPGESSLGVDPVLPVLRVLRASGIPVDMHHHVPARGLAEQRQFLLDQCTASYALFLDDDVLLEPGVIERLLGVIRRERCGFAGNSVIGLSSIDDVRPWEHDIEFWDSGVEPEAVLPDTPQWDRWRLHNAANLWHIQQRLGISDEEPRAYRVAWVAACVLYDVEALRAVGGFEFWSDLPANHCGEDVLAQLRVMKRFGGCGVLPTGAYHLEQATTVPDRRWDAPRLLTI